MMVERYVDVVGLLWQRNTPGRRKEEVKSPQSEQLLRMMLIRYDCSSLLMAATLAL